MKVEKNIFKEVIPSLTEKKYLYKETDNEDEVDINLYLLNKALSYYPEGVLFANNVNVEFKTNASTKMIYDYYYYSLPKSKLPYKKWGKKQVQQKEVEIIRKVYNCNEKAALEYIKLISEEDLKQMVKNNTDFGGRD